MKTVCLPEGMGKFCLEKDSKIRLEQLEEAMQKQTILEGKVLYCDTEHNLHVALGTFEGIVPREDCAMGIKEGKVRDIAILSKVNRPICFTISSIHTQKEKPSIVLNRRKVQENFKEAFVNEKEPGDVLDAVVTRLEAFGVFCDIGAGVIALLPIDHICVSRIPHPKARFFVGQHIKVVLKSIDAEGKITLSHKELLGTWLENAAKFAVGETVPGIVRSIETYGIFIELAPNLAGLAEWSPDVEVGECASVYIKSMHPEKMKIKLILIDHFAKATENFSYVYPAISHIDAWEYSPKNAEKNIQSVF